MSYPTKADQFTSFKRFGDRVMHLGDAHDRGVLTGEKNVRNLEHKLAKVSIPQPVQVIMWETVNFVIQLLLKSQAICMPLYCLGNESCSGIRNVKYCY